MLGVLLVHVFFIWSVGTNVVVEALKRIINVKYKFHLKHSEITASDQCKVLC